MTDRSIYGLDARFDAAFICAARLAHGLETATQQWTSLAL